MSILYILLYYISINWFKNSDFSYYEWKFIHNLERKILLINFIRGRNYKNAYSYRFIFLI